MKKISLLVMATAVSTALFAQSPTVSKKYSNDEIAQFIQDYKPSRDRDVAPSAVMFQKFLQDFANARDAEWETNDVLFRVDFDVKFRDFTAYYSPDGDLLMYTQEVRKKDLPAVVKTTAEAKCPKCRFEDIKKVVQGTETLYDVEMELRDSEVQMFIASDGQFIR
jgi:hypothetical protein